MDAQEPVLAQKYFMEVVYLVWALSFWSILRC